MTRLVAMALLAAAIAALSAACEGADGKGSSAGDGDTDGDSDGDTDGDTDSDGDTDGDSDGDTDTTGTDCDEVDFPVAGNPPDILILLDRSNSMSWGSPESYWSMVTSALIDTTALMDNQIRFGLMVFPDGFVTCEPPPPLTPLVPIEDLNATSIQTSINGQTPNGGGTPTTVAMERAAEYLNSIFDEADKYILLATDGAPNCSTDMSLQCPECDTTQMDLVTCFNHNDCLDDVLALEMAQEIHDSWGVSIYVIGVGGVVGVWDDVMNGIAANGGTEEFYPAEDATQIQDALAEIAAASLSCTFDVDWESLDESVSDDPSLVNLYADGELVPYSDDCSNPYGWHWIDLDTIEMCEGLCDDYKSAVISLVTATFGCESVVE